MSKKKQALSIRLLVAILTRLRFEGKPMPQIYDQAELEVLQEAKESK